MLMLLGVATSESKPRPCFHHCNTVCAHVYYLFCLLHFLLQIYITLLCHTYHPYFTISSPNWCTYKTPSCIRCDGDTRDFVGKNGSILESPKPRKICKNKLETSNLFLQGHVMCYG